MLRQFAGRTVFDLAPKHAQCFGNCLVWLYRVLRVQTCYAEIKKNGRPSELLGRPEVNTQSDVHLV